MDQCINCFTVIFVCMISCQIGLGCKDEPVSDDDAGATVRVEVLPKSINELITDEINITCTPQDLPLDTQDILFMELGKEGEHPLASLKGPTLKLGSDVKNNIQAKGHIAQKLSESFIQLSIKRPFVDDVGVYCCRMFYQNEFGELKMGHVYADVTIENNDKAVLVHLLNKVSELESYNTDLEKHLLKEHNNTKQLENDILEQKTYTDNLEVKMKEALLEQETKVSSRLDQVEEAGKNNSLLTHGLIEKETFSSAFSVYGTENTEFTSVPLTFKNVQLNVGNNYDLSTGVFTTPRTGLYVFHLVALNYGTGDDVGIHLKVNDDILASIRATDTDTYSQSPISQVLSLNEGDRVYPYVFDAGKFKDSGSKYTIFNGYLLKLA